MKGTVAAREGVEVTVSRYLSVSGEGCSVVRHPTMVELFGHNRTCGDRVCRRGLSGEERSPKGARDEQQAGPGKRPFVEVVRSEIRNRKRGQTGGLVEKQGAVQRRLGGDK